MPDDITMPVIAIAGGFTLLFVLACILIVRSRRITRARRALLDARRTSFHLAVIDPTAASHGRAAFERTASPSLAQPAPYVQDDQVVEVVDIPLPPPPVTPVHMPVSDYTTIGYAPQPPAARPDMRVRMHYVGPRMARGSTPGIVNDAAVHALPTRVMPAHYEREMPARPVDWDVPAAPSVTARMRAYRR